MKETYFDEITKDSFLSEETKRLLFEYMEDKTIHSIANVTFEEVFRAVWYQIQKHDTSEEIKTILNQEMGDSMCKCFTGRLSRLVNTLNGFCDLVQVNISEGEQLSNVIISMRNKGLAVADARKELIPRGYSEEEINEWLECY